MTTGRLATAAYSYSVLHILSAWVWLSSSHTEAWFSAFEATAGVIFLPLNLLAGGVCRVAWGTWNLFQARVILGLLPDIAIASLLSVTGMLALVLWLKGRPLRPGARG